jgi:hypothetical protein
MNWGQLGAWAGALLSLSSSIGYLFAGDIRRTLYFFFGFCITAVVAWK